MFEFEYVQMTLMPLRAFQWQSIHSRAVYGKPLLKYYSPYQQVCMMVSEVNLKEEAAGLTKGHVQINVARWCPQFGIFRPVQHIVDFQWFLSGTREVEVSGLTGKTRNC